jgi:type I restriction enzyme, S subunit
VVDFDPVRAKSQGRDRSLPKEIANLFPARLVDSELGEIPEGWETSTIGHEVEVVGGSTPSTKEPAYWDGEHHWATPKDLSNLSAPVLLGTERRITDAGLSQIGSGLLPPGTVLLSSRAPIGYLAIAQVSAAINQGFIAMICRRRLSNVFVWQWTIANMDAILQNANGSTFQEISKASFRPISVMVPTGATLAAFDNLAQRLFSRVVANEKESRTLSTLRDALLPKLISGELQVKDAEKFIERAV